MSDNLVDINDLGPLEPGDYEGIIFDFEPIQGPSGESLIGVIPKTQSKFLKAKIDVGDFGVIKSDIWLNSIKKFAVDSGKDFKEFIKPINGKAEIIFDAFYGCKVTIRAFISEYTGKDGLEKQITKYAMEPTGQWATEEEIKTIIMKHVDNDTMAAKPSNKKDTPF